MSQIAGNVLISIKEEIYFSQFYLRCHSSLDNKLLHVALVEAIWECVNEIYVFLTGLTYLDGWGFKECRNSLLCWLENRQRGIRVSTKALIFRDFGPGSALEHIQDHSNEEFLGGGAGYVCP